MAKWREWSGQGLRLIDMDVKQIGGDNRYTGVFLAGNDGYYLWGNATWENFRAKWEQLAAQGLRLIDFEFSVPATADAALSVAGIPAAAVDEASDGSGAGGLFGMVADTSAPSTPLGARRAGRRSGGFGGLVLPGVAQLTAAADGDPDGIGGLVLTDGEITGQAVDLEPTGDVSGDGGAVLVGAATADGNGQATGFGGPVPRPIGSNGASPFGWNGDGQIGRRRAG